MEINKPAVKELLTNLILEFGPNPIPLTKFNNMRIKVMKNWLDFMITGINPYAEYRQLSKDGILHPYAYEGSKEKIIGVVVVVITQAGLDLLKEDADAPTK